MRIDGNITSGLNTTGNAQQAGQAQKAPSLAEQVQEKLFGRVQPRELPIEQFPELAALLRVLNGYRKKLALLGGDEDDDYRIVLADDTIAAINETGTIFMGAAFLKAHAQHLDILVGVLGHEIGHRPKRWREEKYLQPRQLSNEEREALCRHEETRADMFAGKALAELGMEWEPLVRFVQIVQARPHPEYLPAEARAAVIREAYAARAYRASNRRKIFPDFDRFTSPEGYIGEF